MDREIRDGKGYHWTSETSTGVSRGFAIDNLDSKNMYEAESDFERIFIAVREVLEKSERYCFETEGERLQVCHDVARHIRSKGSKIFKD